MATTYAVNALPNKNAAAIGHAQNAKVAWGYYQIADSGPMAANSIIYMCKVPKGAYITGGRVYGDPIDSSGTSSALGCIHIGTDKGVTGVDGTVYGATSTTAILVSSLPLGPDAVADTTRKNTNQRNWPFGGVVISNGPLLTSDDTLIQVTFTASALALTTGYMRVEVEYYSSTDS
jgi:hypothetical protein